VARSIRPGFGDRAVANLFLTPTLILLIAINVFPLFWSLYLSFTEYSAIANVAPKWVGIANYRELVTNPEMWRVFTTTSKIVVLSVGLQFAIGFGTALLLNRQFRLKGLVTTLLLLPMMLSAVLVGLFWKFLLDPNFGLVNIAWKFLGQEATVWLTDPTKALWSLVIVDTWMWAPFIMLVSLAGLSSVPKHLYEAADVDRASGWFKFRHVTLPIITPLLLIALLFRTMDSFKLFDLVKALTDGGPGSATETVAMQLYRLAFTRFDTGKACALAYITLIIIIGLSNIYIRFLRRSRGELLPDARPIFALPERLVNSAWFSRVEAWWPVALIVLLAVWNRGSLMSALGLFGGAPLVTAVLAVLLIAALFGGARIRHYLAFVCIIAALVGFLFPLYWIGTTSIKMHRDVVARPPKMVFHPSLEQYDKLLVERVGETRKPTAYAKQVGNSVVVASSSTLLAVALGAMAAYALARFRVKGKNDWLFFILSTRMLPPVVIAIPVYLMYVKLGLYDTHRGLILLYTVFNLAFAVWLMKGFFEEVPAEYEEAALLDGYSRLRAFWHITLPQVLPGIAATAVFCMITAWNEFAFALILTARQAMTAPPGLQTRVGAGGLEWGVTAAGTLLFLLPVAIFTFLLRNHLLRGVTFGAIKR
jgi:multiple sugar transport system permease protein